MHFLGKTLLVFAPASFCIPRPNLPVTPDAVHGVAEDLSDLTFTFHFDALERDLRNSNGRLDLPRPTQEAA